MAYPHEPSSLIARVFKAKYFNNSTFIEAQLGHRPSWTWRSIIQGQRVLKLGCLKCITSGVNSKIWGDPWVPKPPFILRSPPPAHFHPDSTVSTLIDSDSHSWKSTLINELFSVDETKSILLIPLNLVVCPDRWYWFYNKNDKFSVKSAYHLIMDNPLVFAEAAEFGSSSLGPSPLWKKIWSLKIPGPHVWSLTGLSDTIAMFKQESGDYWLRDIILERSSDESAFVFTLCSGIWQAFNKKRLRGHACISDWHCFIR
ncbi:hypothetical protein DH2020_044471 [Rehmannia glutinosa]|uniref:Reverse transcriptase zinc-binding domain-containing protein n=1 Tax=Rehmannia glutinosa TaxID=99300 RepID=A0ABR0UH61_REHGL